MNTFTHQQANTFCSNCRQSVYAQAAACPHCGVPPRAENHFCTHCGATINNPKQAICLQCGQALYAVNAIGIPKDFNTKYFDANALSTGFWDVLSKKYFLLNGRARRKEYWMFLLIQTLITAIPVIIVITTTLGIAATTASIEVITGRADNMQHAAPVGFSALIVLPLLFVLFVGFLLQIALICPGICLAVRRLHDIGYTGWLWLINFVPYIGPLALLVIMMFDSQRGDNQHGPNPKREMAPVQ